MNTVKKSLLTSLAFITIFTISCNREDAPQLVTPQLVTPQLYPVDGNWTRFKIDDVVDNQEVFVDYEHVVGCTQDYMDFDADGTGGDNFFVSNGSNCLPGTHPFSWTRNNNTINFEFLGDNYSGEIISNGTELKVTKSGGVKIIYKKV